MRVGTIKQIWRYPFKSMLGELLEHAQVNPQGVLGDRGWAVRDEVRGGITSAKKIPALMHCQARYPDSPTQEQIGPAEITVPDGTTFLSNDPDAAAQLSQALAHQVSIWPIQPAENLDHYRRGKPTHSNPAEELRSLLGLEQDEPLPDLSGFPKEILQYASPPGTYFDAFPLLLVTEASLQQLQSLSPASQIDARRFRPNFLIETEEATGFVETAWPGKQLRIGNMTLDVTMNCLRCVMTTLGCANPAQRPEDHAHPGA